MAPYTALPIAVLYPELLDDDGNATATEVDAVTAWCDYLISIEVSHYPLAPKISLYSAPCVYCGGQTKHLDHVLPKSWTGKEQRARVPMVPSCAPCNATLGGRLFADLAARRDYLGERAVLRYRKRYPRSFVGSTDDLEGKLLGRVIDLQIGRLESVRRIAALGQTQYVPVIIELCESLGLGATSWVPEPPAWVEMHDSVMTPAELMKVNHA